MAVGDQSWVRQSRIQPSPGLVGEFQPIVSLLGNQRVDRFILDIVVNIQFASSAELTVWHDRGIVVLVEYTESPDLGSPPTPTIPIPSLFSSRDVLASGYMRIGGPDVFNNVASAPANENTLHLDARVSRRPPPGGRGIVWVTWSHAAGASPAAIGFSKVLCAGLVTQVAP